MTQQIKTPEDFNTVSDWQRLVYAGVAIAVTLFVATIYHLTEGTLVQSFENYVSNLMRDPRNHLRGVGGAFLMLATFFEMLIAVTMSKALARNSDIFEPDDALLVGFGLQTMTLVVFAVAGFMEGILASQHMFDNPLSTSGIFATAVLGTVALPSVAFLFTTAVRSMWERPHSALTNMLLYSLFGILTILVPTMDIMFAVLSLGLVVMSVVLLPLGYKFRCACDGVTSNWEGRYKRYDPIG